jgi:hypothetical protein
MSSEAIRKRRQRLGLTGKPKQPNLDSLKESFRRFLSVGKTMKQIVAKFPNMATTLLKETYAGYQFFEQRNYYNELVYILLPEVVAAEVPVEQKRWKFHIAHDETGEEQPYLVVQLPQFKGEIKIAPLFDVHYGNFAHRNEKFLSYINWIKDNDNVYAILGGDLFENALDDGRGMTYDQNRNPNTQFSDMLRALAPIAHKILVAVPGNHEARTEKKAGFDVMRQFAERLKIPYFPGPVFMTVLGNTYKWEFYIHHGTGNSQTKGGKANMAARPKSFTGIINFFVSGHVHDCVVQPDNMIVQDPITCRLKEVKFWVVVAPSFLKWYKTYAYKAEFKPPAGGGVSIVLGEDGSYHASLTD